MKNNKMKKKRCSLFNKSKPLLTRKQRELSTKIKKHQNVICKHNLYIGEICAKYLPLGNPYFYDIGNWACVNSPFGMCAYEAEDISHDFCIFCGNPEERK